jgi:hypothetical protein
MVKVEETFDTGRLELTERGLNAVGVGKFSMGKSKILAM